MVFRVGRLFSVLLLAHSAALVAGENVWTTNGPAAGVGGLAVDPATATIYAYAHIAPDRDAVFRSSNHGQTWDFLVEAPPSNVISALGVDPRDSSVYGALNYGPFGATVYQSSDRGITWPAIGRLDRQNVWDFAFPPAETGTILAGGTVCYCVGVPCFYRNVCEAAVLQSRDSGGTWSSLGPLLAGRKLSSLVRDERNPNRFYAAGDGGIFVSTDGGAHWVSPTSGLGGCLSITLAVDPRNTDVLFAGARSGPAAYCGSAYKSRDGGQTWARILSDGFDVTSIVVDERAPDAVYAATGILDPRGARSAVFRTTDGGETWTQLGSSLPEVVDLVLEPSGQILHAATFEGVFDYEIGRQPVAPSRPRDTRTLPWRP